LAQKNSHDFIAFFDKLKTFWWQPTSFCKSQWLIKFIIFTCNVCVKVDGLCMQYRNWTFVFVWYRWRWWYHSLAKIYIYFNLDV